MKFWKIFNLICLVIVTGSIALSVLFVIIGSALLGGIGIWFLLLMIPSIAVLVLAWKEWLRH